MTDSLAAAPIPDKSLPRWLVDPASVCFAATVGIRFGAMHEREFAIAFWSLGVGLAIMLPLMAAANLPFQWFRNLRVVAPPWPQRLLTTALASVVWLGVGAAAYGWILQSPWSVTVSALIAYSVVGTVAVAVALVWKTRSSRP